MKNFKNLLFYAPDGDGADGNDGAGEEQKKPLSFDDFLKDKDMQAEFDRRMSKGINTALEKQQARTEELIQQKLSEAEKLSKMNEIEKAKYEQDRRIEELSKREQAITTRELRAEAMNTLAEKRLPSSLADLLNYKDADTCKASIETVESAFNEAVKLGVEDRLKGGKPMREAQNNDADTSALEDEIYKAMKGR